MAQLLLLNPRRRRKARKSATRRRARRHAPKVKMQVRRGRRAATATIRVMANPRRRRRHAALRAYRRRYRRNPSLRSAFGGVGKTLMSAAQGAVGAIAVDAIMGQVGPRLPVALQTPNTYPLVKAGVALGLGMLGARVRGMGALAARMAEGSLTVTLHSVIRNYMPAGLTLGYVNPATVVRTGPLMGLNAYTGRGVRGLGETPMAREMYDAGPWNAQNVLGAYAMNQ